MIGANDQVPAVDRADDHRDTNDRWCFDPFARFIRRRRSNAEIKKSRHTAEGRGPWRKWIPAFEPVIKLVLACQAYFSVVPAKAGT